MGILKFFSRKMVSHKTSNHQDKGKGTNSTCSADWNDSVTSDETIPCKTSKLPGQKKAKHLKDDVNQTASTTSTKSSSGKISNEQIIRKYIAAKNRHASPDEFLQFWSSEKARVKFDDHETITAMQMFLEMENLYEGFQDLQFNYESIREVRPGEVYVEGVVVSGTHTGDLKFADFPIIPKTGKHVVLDEERLVYSMKDGKITQMAVLGLGGLTGPPGFYVAVGGKLEKPLED